MQDYGELRSELQTRVSSPPRRQTTLRNTSTSCGISCAMRWKMPAALTGSLCTEQVTTLIRSASSPRASEKTSVLSFSEPRQRKAWIEERKYRQARMASGTEGKPEQGRLLFPKLDGVFRGLIKGALHSPLRFIAQYAGYDLRYDLP